MTTEFHTGEDSARFVQPWKRSYYALLLTQFFGSLNDNLFKMIVTLLAVSAGIRIGEGAGYVSLATAIFILPYLLFSGYAGTIADIFSKRRVLVVTKQSEVAIMGLALVALVYGNLGFLFAVLFLMAVQSTFFSPAKYGLLPEMFPASELSRANGLLEMSRYVAVILGSALGGGVLAVLGDRPGVLGAFLIVVAVVGTVTCFCIQPVPKSGARKAVSLNPWREIATGLGRLCRDRTLGPAVAGITFFESLGALLMLDMLLVGKEIMALGELRTGLLAAFAGIGIALGSLTAGAVSGKKVELGLVPLGCFGVGSMLIVLYWSLGSYAQTAANLVLTGFFGGFFFVPLNALLQRNAGRYEKGLLIATNNFLNMAGVLSASAILWLLRDVSEIGSDQILIILGLAAFLVAVCILCFLPEYRFRLIVWSLASGLRRVRVTGAERVPARGPAVLFVDAPSLVDGLAVVACIERPALVVVGRRDLPHPCLRWLLKPLKEFLVVGDSPEMQGEALSRIAAVLRASRAVCVLRGAGTDSGSSGSSLDRRFAMVAQDLGATVILAPLEFEEKGERSWAARHGLFPRCLSAAPSVLVRFGLPCAPNTEPRLLSAECEADRSAGLCPATGSNSASRIAE